MRSWWLRQPSQLAVNPTGVQSPPLQNFNATLLHNDVEPVASLFQARNSHEVRYPRTSKSCVPFVFEKTAVERIIRVWGPKSKFRVAEISFLILQLAENPDSAGLELGTQKENPIALLHKFDFRILHNDIKPVASLLQASNGLKVRYLRASENFILSCFSGKPDLSESCDFGAGNTFSVSLNLNFLSCSWLWTWTTLASS